MKFSIQHEQQVWVANSGEIEADTFEAAKEQLVKRKFANVTWNFGDEEIGDVVDGGSDVVSVEDENGELVDVDE